MIKKKIPRKVLVVGFDGATFDLIKPLVKKGELPTFKKVIENGVYGNLKSTIPPVSAPAWTSFMTGKNPGKHGIFDFRDWDVEKYDESTLVDSTKIKDEKLWNILGSFGKRVGIINLPLTYPPEEVNGFLISGMLTPTSSKNFTYPPSLKDELQDYQIDIEFGKRGFIPSFGKINKKNFSKELKKILKNRLKNAIKLMEREWDLFIVMFKFLDSAQHFFWEDKKYLKEFYKEADKVLDKILRKVGDATVIIMSDHGFGPKSHEDVHINDWLRENGFLKTREEVSKSSIINKKKIASILNSLGLLNFVWKFLPERMKEETVYVYENIDWLKTKAYFSPKHFAFSWVGIDINLKRKKVLGAVDLKEYEKIRDKIIEKLKELKDPKTGEKVIEKIYRKEEVYNGKHMDGASDIFLKFKFPYRGERSLGNPRLISPSFSTNIKGEHKIDGIFIACGPNIKKGKEIDGAEIIDLAPTILKMFGLPIPADMDGEVLRKIFKPGTKLVRKSTYQRVEGEKEKIKTKIRVLKFKSLF